MPRPRLSEDEETVSVTANIPTSLYDKACAEARKRHNGNLSAVVREALARHLGHRDTRKN